MKSRKTISLILAMVMLVCVCFAGCAGQQTTSEQSSSTQDAASSEAASSEEEATGPDISEAVELTWYTYDSNYEDEQKVLDAMNEILNEKLNATLTINRISPADYESKMGIMINSLEEFDICFTSNWKLIYTDYVLKDAFVDITDMLPELAPGLWASMSEEVWDAARVNGKIYGVINQQIQARSAGFVIQKGFYDEYDGDQVVDFATLADFMIRVKEGENAKGINNNNLGASSNWLYDYQQTVGWETLGSLLLPGVALAEEEHPQVFNQYDTDVFREIIDAKARLQMAGVIDADILTTSTPYDYSKMIANFTNLGLANEEEYAAAAGWESAVVIRPGKSYLTTNGCTSTMNAISSTSKNPERAMMLLELMNTDHELFCLASYGIEGTHYNLVGDNQYEWIEGTQYKGTDWKLGNTFIGLAASSNRPTILEETQKFNQEATPSSLLGFNYDPTEMATEVSNILAIVNERTPLFYAGLYAENTEAEYQKFLEELKNAGSEKVMADMQAQIDAFIASK